jgi:hypothetical protein
MKYINNSDKIPLLKSLVDYCSKLIDDEIIQKEIISKFSGLLEIVTRTITLDSRSPCLMSSTKQAYRGYTKQI